jgi:hypothetical protein
VTQDGQTVYHARWNWPEQRFTHRCHVAVCRQLPRISAVPEEAEAVYRSTIERAEDEVGSIEHILIIPPDWTPSVVVVWGTVDLGFQTLYTPAVELGHIGPPAKKGNWGFRREK